MAKWKRILFIIVAALVIVRIVYISIRGEVDKQYYTSGSYDLSSAEEIPCQNISETFICGERNLNSLEFLFNNIVDNGTFATLDIWNGNMLIYQAKISLSKDDSGTWKKVYVNAVTQENTAYTLVLNANQGSNGQAPTVFVVKTVADEVLSSCSGDTAINGSVAIRFGYLKTPHVLDLLSVIALWIIFVVAVYYVLLNWEHISDIFKKGYTYAAVSVSPDVFISILEILAAIIVINCSGIEFQPPTRVILYAISFIAAVKVETKASYIQKLASTPTKKVFLYILYAYAAFALVGQRLFIYPLTVKLTVAGIFVYGVTIFWFVPVINTLLVLVDAASKRWFCNQLKMKTAQFVLLCTLVLLLPAFYCLIAYNPGVSSWDTLVTMARGAHHLHGIDNWHPAFYNMVLRTIQKISDTTYAVIAVQYFFWAYVIIELLLFLRKKGTKESILLCVAVFFGFNAGNFLYINTIWKDIPYTLSLFWAVIILAKISIDSEEYRYKWFIYLEFVVSMVGICLYRHNGVVPFVLIAAVLLIVLRKNKRVWGAVAAAIALVLIIQGPVYRYFEVEKTGSRGIYIGLGQDVLGVYYAGGEVSENTLKMITMMTESNNAEYAYTPTWSRASYDVDITLPEFIINYIDTFLKNPITMLRAIIAREDALWDIYSGRDTRLGCVNFYGSIDSTSEWLEYSPEWLKYYSARHYVSLYPIIEAATAYTAKSQWISAIEWRSGLLTLLGVISIAFAIFKRGIKKYLLVLTPMLGQILSLLLTIGWSDFRYFWPLNLMNTALILIVMVIVRQGVETPKDLG